MMEQPGVIVLLPSSIADVMLPYGAICIDVTYSMEWEL